MHLILGDRLTSERRDVIHEIVKDHANGWWHQLPDAWIVGGKAAKEWRDLLMPVVRGTTGSIFVVTLPDSPDRDWSFFGPDAEAKMEWLKEHYV